MSLSPVEQIKARLGIQDVLETYLKLEKAGGNYKARCPFHSEKTPSFVVSPDRDTFHCFGCGKSGDIFDFVSEIEGLDFRGALRVLADRAGVELKKESPAMKEKKSERDTLFAVMELATLWFEKHLYNNKPVAEYLKKRGLSGDTAKSFRIGFVPEEWRGLYEHLATKGVNPEIMEKAGLVIKSPKGYYDRFRNRIMFPITDSSGRVVAFTGRIFTTDTQDEKTAKYINSPETDLYNKSDILYGFDKAKMSIRKVNACVIVEGQMDLIMSHQVGVTNAIAVSGTALTELHLHKIKRLTDTLIFAFDADAAGLAASQKGVDMALHMGFEVKVVSISKGMDPADLILHNPQNWEKAISVSKNIIEFLLDKIFDGRTDDRALRKEVETSILPYITRLESSIERAHYVSEIAERLRVRETAVWESLEKIYKLGPNTVNSYVNENTTKKENLSRQELLEIKILGIYGWQLKKVDEAISIDYEERFQKITERNLKEVLAELSEETKEGYILEAEVVYADCQSIDDVLKGLLHNLEIEIVELSMKDLSFKMKELSDTSPEKKSLLEKFVQLMQRKKQLDK